MATHAQTPALEQRIVAAASAKLHCVVVFARWERRATGDVPVLRVPVDAMASAHALGLTVEVL